MFVIRLLEALPLLVVLGGLASLWARSGPLAGIPPDRVLLTWAMAALIARQATFMSIANLEWRSSARSGIVLAAACPLLVLLCIPSRRWRAVLAWLFVLGATLVLTVDNLYYVWFGDTFPAVAWKAIGQIGAVTGGARTLVTMRDAWPFVDVILAMPLVVVAWRDRSGRVRSWRRAAAAIGVVLAVVLVSAWQTTAPIRADRGIVTQRFSNLSLVEHIGPFAFHALDSWLLSRRMLAHEMLSDAVFEDVLQWLKERAPQRAAGGPWFGIAKGMNLIVIQVESLEAPVVDMRVDGQPVMPNLSKLAAQHLSFTQVFDQTDEGRTSDAEWIMLTSQFPEAQGAAVFADAGNHLVGLPSVLAGRGYDSLSAVAFSPSFWNRRVMHQNAGFFRSYFAGDFAPGASIGWGLNDRDFLLQMTPRLAAARQPFAAWLITLSLHYPFEDFPDQHKRLKLASWERTPFGNYLHGMHYFDAALGDFIESLSQQHLLDNSVLVVTGDHSAGFRWQPEIAHAMGFANDIAHWTINDRVPLVIRVPGAAAHAITMPVGQLDFAPTVLGLLGVDSAPLPYVGRNVLASPADEPVIRRKGSWVDSRYLFLLRGPTNGSHCYDRTTMLDVPMAQCDAGSALALRKALMPRRVHAFDLQQRLAARLAADAAQH